MKNKESKSDAYIHYVLDRFCKLMTDKEQVEVLTAISAYIITGKRTIFTDRFLQLAFDMETEYIRMNREKGW